MAIPTRTLDDWMRRALGNMRTSFPGFPLGLKKFLGRMAAVFSKVGWGVHKAVEDLDQDIVPNKKTSPEVLAQWADDLGLPDGSGVAGAYGALVPQPATGGAATLTGAHGTVYADAILATAEDGTTEVALDGTVTIPGAAGFGSIAAKFKAVTPGTIGNLPVGTVCSWQSPPFGADPTFTLTSPLEGGTDAEEAADLFSRIQERGQTPPRGGADPDYRKWALEVAEVETYVYDVRSGTGTVDLVITQAGSGQARIPSLATQAKVQVHIDEVRPVGVEQVNVLLPDMPNSNGHSVRLRVKPSKTDYNFDWDDTAGPYTVDVGGSIVGPPSKIRLNTVAPISLTQAIDNFKNLIGSAPRLQVISTGSVVNPQIKAVDYLTAGGKTTLTLEAVPDGWTAPADGDTVFAGGAVVATIAAGILDLCDSLGPSRVSGYGDAITPWVDTLTISGLNAVAENALDSDGTKFIAEVQPGMATIDGVAQDVEAQDSTVSTPGLLFLKSVAVTQ